MKSKALDELRRYIGNFRKNITEAVAKRDNAEVKRLFLIPIAEQFARNA